MTFEQIDQIGKSFGPDLHEIASLVDWAKRSHERIRILEAELDLSSRLKIILDASDRASHMIDGAKKLRDSIVDSDPELQDKIDTHLKKIQGDRQ